MRSTQNELCAGTRTEQIISTLLLLMFWTAVSLPANATSPQGIINVIQHLIVGLPLSILVVKLVRQPIFTQSEIDSHRPKNIFRLLGYSFYLMWQILVSGIDVARRVMRPVPNISPGVVKFRTPLSDELQIAINANSITLTPGTITLDVAKDGDGSIFWVHSISKEGLAGVKADKGFVKKISEVYGK